MADQSTRALLIEALRRDQQQRWEAGERIPAEAYLAQHPTLETNADGVIELVYQEILLREERGETPRLEEYLRRFPHFATELEPLFEVHEALAPACPIPLLAEELTQGPEPGAAGTVTLGSGTVAGCAILEELGRGSMGVVYKARQKSLNRIVALKMLLAGAHASPSELARFQTEAKTLARLHHPNIVQIHEVGRLGDHPYMILEYVAGGSLAQKLNGTPLPARAAAQLVETVARAIHFAHQRGIVHRDLKPANILLSPLIPKVTDFGLAKMMEGSPLNTQSGVIIGTISYMAPEQAEGKTREIGPAADTYALGAVLYELLTGRPPFRADTPLETLRQVQEGDPVPPRRLQPKSPLDLETICLKALAKAPGRRYSSALALADDLKRFLQGEPIQARPIGPWERTWKWARCRPTAAALVVVSALATCSLLAGGLWYNLNLQTALAQLRDAKETVEKQRDLARLNLYVKDMKAAHRAWEDVRVDRMRELLRPYQSGPEADASLGGFEWQYLWRLCHSDRLTLPGHAGGGASVVFSPDGRRLSSAGADKTVKIWEMATGQLVHTLEGHQGKVAQVVYSPDGRRLASASIDKTVRLWDAATGRAILVFSRHASAVASVAFSPDGRRLASAGNDGQLKVWSADTGRESLSWQSDAKVVTSVTFHPDGLRLASGGTNGVQVWDLATGKRLQTHSRRTLGVTSVTFSPDGRLLAAAGQDKTVTVWDTTTEKEVCTFQGHSRPVTCVVFRQDGLRLASTSTDGTLQVWTPGIEPRATTFKGHSGAIFGVGFSPDGLRLASTGADGTVKIWDAGTPQEAVTLPWGNGPVTCVAFSPSGQSLAAGTIYGTLAVRETATFQEILSLPGHSGKITSVAFSPDGQVLVSAGDDGRVKMWDPVTGQELRVLAGHTGTIPRVTFNADGSRLASAGSDGAVKVWDPRTGQELLSLPAHAGWVRGVTFSPNGQRLATAGLDQLVKVWDATTGQELLQFKARRGGASSVVFSPDGQRLATGGVDRRVKVWDAASGECVLLLQGHAGSVRDAIFSRDGRRLASAGDDKTVKVWETVTGQEVLSFQGHRGAVTGVAWTSDGLRLATASHDGTVTVLEGAPLTPATWAQRDARRLLQELFAQRCSRDQARARIREDAGLSNDVRQHALRELDSYRQNLVTFRALSAVRGLFARPLPRPEVLEAVRTDDTLVDPVKQRALALAAHYPENAQLLNNASWEVACRPDAPADAYRLALNQAQAACRLVPGHAAFLNTLGAAQYRAGKYQEALETLTEAARLNETGAKGSQRVTLGLLAMAQHQLGHPDRAQATLGRSRQIGPNRSGSRDPREPLLLDEAEKLVGAKERKK